MTKLEKMLHYVSEHNEFYKKRIKEYGIKSPLDITQWPILTREDLQKNRYNMFSDGYMAMYLCHQLKTTTSSGTSGAPVNVYWDKVDYNGSMMSLWRKRKDWYGISPCDKKVEFTLSHINQKNTNNSVICLETEYQLLVNAASLFSEEAYKSIIRRINDFKPKWLYIQPFILEQLIYYYKKYDYIKPSSLIYIESVGEILTQQLRKDAVNFFKVPIANLYGSEEHNGIAYECPHGNMHILEDNVYLEQNAVITNINNHAFPLIRYNQGDVIKLSAREQCKCGTISSYVLSIEGRIRQSFEIDGIMVNTYMLSEIVNIVNNQFSGMIIQYSFCYSVSKRELECYISICPENENWVKNIALEIKKTIFERIPASDKLSVSVINRKREMYTNKVEILKITI